MRQVLLVLHLCIMLKVKVQQVWTVANLFGTTYPVANGAMPMLSKECINVGIFRGEREISKNVVQVGCGSWGEFRSKVITDFFADGLFRKGEYLFRGQGSDGWTLSTSFDRWYNGDRGQKESVADLLLQEFAARV